jgi:hypothetical protein
MTRIGSKRHLGLKLSRYQRPKGKIRDKGLYKEPPLIRSSARGLYGKLFGVHPSAKDKPATNVCLPLQLKCEHARGETLRSCFHYNAHPLLSLSVNTCSDAKKTVQTGFSIL